MIVLKKISTVFFITCIIFCVITSSYSLIDSEGEARVLGFGFPLVWYTKDISGSMACIIDIRNLIIDFGVYLIVLFFIIRKRILSYLLLNKFYIPLIFVTILILLLFSVCLMNPTFTPIDYKVDYSTIKLKLGFYCN